MYRDPTPIRPTNPEYDKDKVDPRVSNYTKQVREKTHGRDTREAMARAEEISSIVASEAKEIAESTGQRQDAVEQQFDTLLGEWSDDKPIDNAETIAARTNTKESKTYENLGKRLDEEYGKVTAQLAETEQEIERLETEKATKQELQQGLAPKADITYVDTALGSLSDGSPKELFYSLNALIEKYPNGTAGPMLVFDSSHTDGAHSYIWDGEKWKDIGLYQSDGLADGSATFIKRTVLGTTGTVLAGSNIKIPNIDTINKIFNFYNGTYIYYGNQRHVIGYDISIDLSAGTGQVMQHIIFNIATKQITLFSGADIGQLDENDLLLYSINWDNNDQNYIKGIYHNDCTIDGFNFLDDSTKGAMGQFISGSLAKKTNINLTNKIITYYHPFYILFGDERYNFDVEDVTLNIPSGSGFLNVYLNTETKKFKVVKPAETSQISKKDLFIMALNFDSTAQSELVNVTFTNDYTVNGEPHINKKIDEYVSKTEFGIMLFGDPREYPVFDFNRNKLFVPYPFYVHYNKKRFDVYSEVAEEIEVDLPTARNCFIYFNTKDKSFRTLTSAQVRDGLSGNDILIATVFQRHVTMVGGFEVVGNEPSNNRVDYHLVDVNVNGIFNTDKVYDDYSNFADATAAEVEDMFDNLVARYSITKEFLGNEATGIPLNAYHHTPQLPESDYYGKIPNILLVCGIHGYEHANSLVTYLMLKQMYEDWEKYPHLEQLSFNTKITIVPVANPYGWNNYIRHNSNGVDLNRNFPSTGWTLQDPESNTYGGPSPASELETQYLVDLINRNDFDIVYDFHNFAANEPEDQFLWIPTGRDREQRLALSLISSLTRKWSKDFEFVDPNTFVGYTNKSNAGGTTSEYARENGAYFSSTFEIRDRWVKDTESGLFSQNVCKAGVEAITNWLLINLKELIK